MSRYNAATSEPKWQAAWDKAGAFVAAKPSPDKPSYYALEMFPYPSGKIHMGHVRNYAMGDVIARYKLAQGFNVLHPMGWDAFGMPAENAAMEKGVHPKGWTYDNIDAMRAPMKRLGFALDWTREFATCDVAYYKQQQAIFLAFMEAGLVYRKKAKVNWDPVDMTVLANEQVIDGKGWRSGAEIETRELDQWFFKITHYADELESALDGLERWPEKVRTMQKNWIGRSEGLQFRFEFDGDAPAENLEVYTTRPDTIYGASFVALAADHPLIIKLAKDNETLTAFREDCNKLGTTAEAIDKAEKVGVDTGLRVKHPMKAGETLPVYAANFVLMGYGTGAVFGCPAHDQRDFDFATKYGLPIIPVVKPADADASTPPPTEAYTGEGVLYNSEFLNGMTKDEGIRAAIAKFEEMGLGTGTVQYRLRDWGVSRQRYWGAPIPIIYCDDCDAVPVPAADLPVELPEDVTFAIRSPTPLGISPGSPAGPATASRATRRLIKKRRALGCRLINILAGLNMPCCICFTRGSLPAAFAIAAFSTCRAASPLPACSPKAWSLMPHSKMKTVNGSSRGMLIMASRFPRDRKSRQATLSKCRSPKRMWSIRMRLLPAMAPMWPAGLSCPTARPSVTWNGPSPASSARGDLPIKSGILSAKPRRTKARWP